MAERMLASSELVSAQKTSTLSMFSSTSSSSSAASPTSTIELRSCSEILRARFESRSITLTWFSSSSVCASRKPMLPPPAMTTRFTGSSSFCISFMTTRMSCVAATKKTSSPSSITVSPSGSMLSLLRYMAATRASTVAHVALEFADRAPDERAALQRLDPDEPDLAVGEVHDLQRARVADEPLDVRGDRFFGTQVHVDRESRQRRRRLGGFGRDEQARMLREITRADAGDLGFRAEEVPRHVARDHVGLVAVRECDEHVGIARAGRLERARARRVALHRADVDAVLEVAQQHFVGVDDGDVVGLFAGQVVGRCPADLAGPEDDDFQAS